MVTDLVQITCSTLISEIGYIGIGLEYESFYVIRGREKNRL